jgi:hypothetical protein
MRGRKSWAAEMMTPVHGEAEDEPPREIMGYFKSQ